MAYQMRGGGSFEDTKMRAITAKTAGSDNKDFSGNYVLTKRPPYEEG